MDKDTEKQLLNDIMEIKLGMKEMQTTMNIQCKQREIRIARLEKGIVSLAFAILTATVVAIATS